MSAEETLLTPKGPFEGTLPLTGLGFRVHWHYEPTPPKPQIPGYPYSMLVLVLSSETWWTLYRHMTTKAARTGIPIEIIEREFIRSLRSRQGLSDPSADRKPPAFAKPLAPLPEWLEEVDRLLKEKR